jgi:hypothetical protein
VSAAEAAEAIRPPRRFANKTEFRLLALGMTSEGDAMSARLLAASHVRLRSLRRRPRASKIAPVLESGFHRLTLVFGLASVAIWTYVVNEWWGGEWWGLLLAIAAAIPVGLVVAILPSILFKNLRRLPLVNDALLTGVFILGGLVLGVYALIAFEGATLAMVALSGAEIFGAGIRER